MGIHICIEQLLIIRWYCVWFLAACDLKNSTLLLLRGDSDLYTFIAKRKLAGRRKKIGYNPILSQGFIRVLCFRRS